MVSIGQLAPYHGRVAMFCAVLSAVPLAGDAQDRYPVDWQAVAAESMEYFSDLLGTDTSNPPGNETEAARYLQRVLQQEGIEAELFALDPTRANLVARLRGNGSKRPILIMGHTDVVGVQRENWSVDPFGAVIQDGYVYGRGALDDKDNATAANGSTDQLSRCTPTTSVWPITRIGALLPLPRSRATRLARVGSSANSSASMPSCWSTR